MTTETPKDQRTKNVNVFQRVNGKWTAITSVSAEKVEYLKPAANGYVKLALASGIPVRIEVR